MATTTLKRNIGYVPLTWTGDSSGTTTISKQFRLLQITVHFDASITNDCTVTVDALEGTNYDTVLQTADNSGGVTDNLFAFRGDMIFPAGTEIVVACNVGTDNAYAVVYYELV